jgi:hypothetical protein
MLACAQRRFASYKLLKRCTVIFVILSPITTLSDDVVESLFPDVLPVITCQTTIRRGDQRPENQPRALSLKMTAQTSCKNKICASNCTN